MIAGGYGLKLGILTTLALAILAARQESWTIHRLPPDDWSQWSFKVARTLQATGLGSRATVLCDAAGVIPFISGFNQLDRVGLTNNVLSGRLYLPLDVRERYIWSQPVDVYMGYEPPAAKGAEHPEDDPRMHTAYVTKVLMGLTVFPGQDRVFVQEPRLLHQRMRELRDNWYWVGEMEWPAWQWWRLKLFLYVRKDSPYAARLLPSLRTIVTFQPDQIDLDRLQESLIQGAITG